MSDEGWTWELTSKAQTDLDALDPSKQDRNLDKLDEIVDSPWRGPPEYGEPRQNRPTERSASGISGYRSRSTGTDSN